jgi:transcriptional regulator with XRE-family HTH domain
MSDVYNAQIGARICARRQRAEVMQSELALCVGISQATLSRIEAGSVPVRTEVLHEIARALGCRVADLVPD